MKTRTGMTIIELLVTLSIGAILMTLALTGVSAAREASRRYEMTLTIAEYSTEPPYQVLVDFVTEEWESFSFMEEAGTRCHFCGLGYTAYNHATPPNSEIAIIGDSSDRSYLGMVVATSVHPGGVNLARLDGSVHFVGEDIDDKEWRALATIAAGD